jgi:hypothetical protein
VLPFLATTPVRLWTASSSPRSRVLKVGAYALAGVALFAAGIIHQ